MEHPEEPNGPDNAPPSVSAQPTEDEREQDRQSTASAGDTADEAAEEAVHDVPDTDVPDTDVPDTEAADTEAADAPAPADGGWGGSELVASVYGPLIEFYERIDARLREVPEDVPPVGWAPHVAALRALRDGRVAGEWEVLARFLVAPEPPDSEALRLVHVEEGGEAGAVREAVKELTAADARALLIAPTPEQAADLLRSMEGDPEVFSLLIETRPESAEARSVQTRALPPVEEPPQTQPPVEESVQTQALPPVEEPPPLRDPGSNGTVEFRPVGAAPDTPVPNAPAPDTSSTVTRAEPLPVLPPEGVEPIVPAEGPSAPETRVRSAALRPVGEAWRRAWQTEARLLRRGLMWLEQWPRDAAALRAVQAENLRRGAELEAEQAALRSAIEDARTAAEEAEGAAAAAETEAERFAAVQSEAEAELEEPRAEAERLQAEADRTSDEAGALTRTADASYARCIQLDEREKTARSELRAARETEASLTDELARAREALPAAAEEAHRLTAADADAAAEGHAAYYRLVSAESAVSAVRRKMTLGQRLHVASPPAELRALRDEAKARARDADEAARRAREAKDAAEHAERVRRGLATFVSEGGARLRQAQEAQERLGTELTWLATEREKAGAEHREQARLASQAVERATEAGLRARAAHQVVQEIADRVSAARTSREEALATAARARAGAETATATAAETAAVLARRTEEAAAEMSARAAEVETAALTEARSRENVVEICGADPTADPAAVPAHQRRAMARIEQLTAYLEGGAAVEGDVLLRTADVVIGTPLGAALTAPGQEFDTLIVADAGAVTDAEFLIGAVRTHRWVLIGASGSRPPEYREYTGAPSGLPGAGPFGRAPATAD